MELIKINYLIVSLNQKRLALKYFTKDIGNNVEVIKVWGLEDVNGIKPNTFFLIKNSVEYVSAILIMSSDLHWFTLPKYRQKSFLSIALKSCILPYLFDVLEFEEQRITINKSEIGIDNYNSSVKLALNIGFKKIDDSNFVIKNSNVTTSYAYKNIVSKGLNIKEVASINEELSSIAKRLKQINTQITFAYNVNMEDYTNASLEELSTKVEFNKLVLSDIVEDFK